MSARTSPPRRPSGPFELAARLGLALAAVTLAAAPAAAGADPPLPAHCASPEAHGFDFLIGDWDVSSSSRNRRDPADPTWYATGAARLKVYPVLGGCALVEHLEGTFSSGPVRVFSVRAFDAGTGEWVLVLDWPWGEDPVPSFLTLRGRFEGDRADFPFRADGATEGPPDHRYSYRRTGADSYRWESAISSDGGATWTSQWRMDGSRRDPARAHPLFVGPWLAGGRGPVCAGSEHRDFDALIGAWRGSEGIGGRSIALDSLPILGGCAIMEFLTVAPAAGGGGEPWRQFRVRAYDRSRGLWVQVGIDPGGPPFEVTIGGPKAGELVLTTDGGTGRPRARETFLLRPDGSLRWERETASDRGRVWKTMAAAVLDRVD